MVEIRSKTHILKVWPKFYGAIVSGMKTFELRERRDRDFKVGDMLYLEEWSLDKGHSGRTATRRIAYILEGGQFGLAKGYCIMALAKTGG